MSTKPIMEIQNIRLKFGHSSQLRKLELDTFPELMSGETHRLILAIVPNPLVYKTVSKHGGELSNSKMKVIANKNDTKKRKRDETQDSVDESPKKAKVHAQRKFAQGASYNSPSITLIKDKVRPPASVTSPGLMLSAKRPNTEDFLTFLCFRRTSILPPKLDFFKDAFKEQPIPTNYVQKSPASSTPENAAKLSAKKSEKIENGKKTQTPVQALRRKYHEQRLAKQNPTNVTKLAQKVKGKNMIRTRSSTLQEEKPKATKEVALLNDGKETLSGLRSGLQRTSPARSELEKKNKRVVEMKNLRSRIKGKIVNSVVRSISLPEKKSAKNFREAPTNKNEIVKNVKSPEICGKSKDVRVTAKRVEGLSDFSSDDNEPLLAVKKGKAVVKGKKMANGIKEVARTNSVKTRSQITEILPPTSHVAIRPTRKTKEAAALYMEMITKKLVSPEKSGDDDRSSVDSFPELPNAKRNEQRETEIKARAMAMKKGNTKENNTNVTDGKERGLRSSAIAVRKRELSRRSESSPAKSEALKKSAKDNLTRKLVKEEQARKNTREPTKKQPQKQPMTKKHVKEEASKKFADEPPKKIIKDEVRSRSLREDQFKKSVKEEKKTDSAEKEETLKKIIKEEIVKKGFQDDLLKRTLKEDSHKKNLRDDTVKKGSEEELSKKDAGKKVPEDDSAKKIVKDDINRKSGKEETTDKVETQSDESAKRAIKEEPGKKAVKDETVKKHELEDITKKPIRDDYPRRESAKMSANEDWLKKAVNDEVNKKNVKEESIKEETMRKLSQDFGKKSSKEEIPKKTAKEDVAKRDSQEDASSKTGKEDMPKKVDVSKKVDDAMKKTSNSSKRAVRDDIPKRQTREDVLKNEEQAKDEEATKILQEESVKEVEKEEIKKGGQDQERGKKGQKEDMKKTAEVDQPKKGTKEIALDEGRMTKDDFTKKDNIQKETNEVRKEDLTEKKGSEENKEQVVDEEKKDRADQTKEIPTKKQAKIPLKEEARKVETPTEENEIRPSMRARKQEEHEAKPKRAADRANGPKRPSSLPKKGCSSGSGSSTPSSSWLPPPGSDSNLVEAPTFYPTERDFQDPLEFFERIRPAAESFGLCRIVPPSTFKPDCKVSDDMRFTAYNQYVHRMFHRWGPNIKEMMAIKKYLATQSISLKQPPWIGGIEVDLPRLYQSVQNCGGLMKVMEKKKWHQVADMMRIPKAAQDRVTKLDDIYCKYLLPYDTLSHDERQKLFDEVECDWLKRQESANDGTDEESEEESYIDECEECIVKGRNMALNQFYRIARNTMSMWFKTQEPTPSDVENEFWRHVSERTNHVCVHSGSIDSSGWGYGFPVAKNNTFSRHPWNLKVLTNNSGSVLRSLGPVMGVTVPTLHVGMVFTAFCWYRDPHGLPWVEYLHTGAPKIWYGISDDNSSVFKDALTKLLPRYIKNKKIWLPSDTAMVPPALLVEQGVSLCHTIQKPGQFILVFPRAFTSSICTGYLVSESVYFAQPSWLTTAEQVFRDIQDCCEPTMFSLEKLLFSIATDTRSSVEVLKQVLPMVWHIKQNEIDGRKTLLNLGLKVSERLPVPEQGGNKKKKGRWAQDGEGDYECEVCRTNLCVSLVINSQEEGVTCLPHAIELLTQKRHHLKYCKLMYSYTQEELCELVEKLEQRIESKSQKKVQSKSTPSVK